MSEPIKVNILDRDFMVAAPEEAHESLHESARLLDARMREIRSAGKIVGIDRIAIMAALNITHEMLQAQGQAAVADDADERLRALNERIASFLDEDPS